MFVFDSNGLIEYNKTESTLPNLSCIILMSKLCLNK